jgi:hypothetical protein
MAEEMDQELTLYNSPSAPVMTPHDYEQIHGRRPYYNPNIISHENDGEFWREFASFFTDLSELEKEIIVRDAKKVYGALPVKIAVSLYAHGYSVEKILNYLNKKGIKMTTQHLYSLCYRSGLKKVRQSQIIPFERVSPDDLFDVPDRVLEVVKKDYYKEYEKALHDPDFMGKKSITVARLVMKKVLRRWCL